jgi:hypothetical protein
MRAAWSLLFLAIGASAGCVDMAYVRPDVKPVAPAAKPALSFVPVTADQVTEANAHDRAEALRQELDRANWKDATPPAAIAPSKILP